MSRKIAIGLVVVAALIVAVVYLQQKKVVAPTVLNEVLENTSEDVKAVDESKTEVNDIEADLSQVPNDSPDAFMAEVDGDLTVLQEN